jgi:hypothetical protein
MIKEKEQDWYFSFGCGHSPNEHKYVKIYGTFKSTRDEMFSRFGFFWCMQYESFQALNPERWGDTELILEDQMEKTDAISNCQEPEDSKTEM